MTDHDEQPSTQEAHKGAGEDHQFGPFVVLLFLENLAHALRADFVSFTDRALGQFLFNPQADDLTVARERLIAVVRHDVSAARSSVVDLLSVAALRLDASRSRRLSVAKTFWCSTQRVT